MKRASSSALRLHVAKPFPANEIAPLNIILASTTLEVDHGRPFFPSNDVASLNILSKVVALLVFHELISPLKASADSNILEKFETFSVFHGRSWLKLGAL